MDDLLDAIPLVVLAVALGALVTYYTRGGGHADGRGGGQPSTWRERIRILAISVGVVLIAPTVGYGIGTALSLSPTADSRLAVAATGAGLIGVLLWRKLRLRRKIG